MGWVFGILIGFVVVWAVVSDAIGAVWFWVGFGLAVVAIGILLWRVPSARDTAKKAVLFLRDKWREDTIKGDKTGGRINRATQRRVPIPKSTQERVEKRANGVCENPDCMHKLGLVIHHIDHNNENPRYNNLIMLCRNHHDLADKHQFRKETLRRWCREKGQA